jgi:hypothetical protein
MGIVRAAMTPPATPDSDPSASAGPGERLVAPHARPAGETGGHTVQDWEQPMPIPYVPKGAAASAVVVPQSVVDEEPDEPSPPTDAIYLRPVAEPAAEAAPAFDAAGHTLAAQSGALVEAITRGVAEALAVSLRPVVATTVAKLIPMILSFGSTPDGPGGPEVSFPSMPVFAEPEAEADAGESA